MLRFVEGMRLRAYGRDAEGVIEPFRQIAATGSFAAMEAGSDNDRLASERWAAILGSGMASKAVQI